VVPAERPLGVELLGPWRHRRDCGCAALAFRTTQNPSVMVALMGSSATVTPSIPSARMDDLDLVVLE
jgi:hypothetical protein